MSDKRSRRNGSTFARAESGVEPDDGAAFDIGGGAADAWAALPAIDAEQSTAIMNNVYGTPERSASELESENIQLRQIAAPKFAINESRLEVVGKVTEQDVLNKIREVVETQKADYWALGDLIAFMQDQQWGTTYKQLSEITGKSVQTLTDYVWVVRHIHFSFRKEKGLTLNHFKAVAPFTPVEQEQWVRRIQENKWSVAQLKLAIEGHNIPAKPDVKERGWQRVHDAVKSAIKADGSVTKADVAAWLRSLADEIEGQGQ